MNIPVLQLAQKIIGTKSKVNQKAYICYMPIKEYKGILQFKKGNFKTKQRASSSLTNMTGEKCPKMLNGNHGLSFWHAEVENVQTELIQQDACLGQAIETTLQVVSLGLYAAVLLEQDMYFVPVL